jgi:peptide/nickel transport system substrate-binding protein
VKTDPVGSSVWVFDSYETGVAMRWKRHETFHDSAIFPHYDGVEASLLKDPQRLIQALQSGDFDLAGLSGSVYADAHSKVDPAGKELFELPGSLGGFYFNYDNEPFRDKRVRQAMSHAMDRPNILKAMDQTGKGDAHSHIAASLSPYWMSPLNGTEWGDSAQYWEYDPAKAKALLQAATGSDTLNFKVIANVDRYGATAQQAWELVASDVRGAGINAQNVYQEYGAYIQSSYFGKITDPGAITLGHLFGTVLDPDDLFMACYWSGSARHNWGGTTIPEMAELDTMFLKQRTLLDLEERTEYVQDIQRKMAESFLVIPVVNWPTVNFIQGWAKDAHFKATYAFIMETFSKAYFTDERIARG